MSKSQQLFLVWFFICLVFSPSSILYAQKPPIEPGEEALLSWKPFIYHHKPDTRGGRAYKLVYLVDIPLPAYWKFKTDFDNDFLMGNKYIEHHRFVLRKENIAVQETVLNLKENYMDGKK
jgi:hypothetical protein